MKRPNIIWVFGDQHRGQALSCAGDPNVSTPNIDRMAVEGVWFRRAIANNPWCCPCRFSLMTGLYPHRGIDRTPPPQPLDTSLPTAATILAQAGYHTAYIGKWHLDGHERGTSTKLKVVPRERRGGFHHWIGYENNNSQYDCYVHGHTIDGSNIQPYRLPGYETDALTDLMLEELDRRAAARHAGDEQPFFAVLSVQPPHGPNLAPPQDMARHRPGQLTLRPNVPPVPRVEEVARRELAGYYAQIENLDTNLGRIFDHLFHTGMLDDTYVIFFSDHGDCMGSHGFREKSSPWEESIRIPLLIAGGVPYAPRRHGPVDSPISAIDILPTTLGIAGVDVPDHMLGFNFAPALRRENDLPLPGEPDEVYLQHTVRKLHLDGIDRAWRGIVTRDNWKYVCLPGQPFAMFNLNEDPYELANLAYNQRFIRQREHLQNRLAHWIQHTGDTFDLPEL